jgi:hypothetical protein
MLTNLFRRLVSVNNVFSGEYSQVLRFSGKPQKHQVARHGRAVHALYTLMAV